MPGVRAAPHGGPWGRFVARGGRHVQLGGADRARNVVAIFPSLKAVEGCYRSAAYQAALVHAKGAAVRDLVVVEAMRTSDGRRIRTGVTRVVIRTTH